MPVDVRRIKETFWGVLSGLMAPDAAWYEEIGGKNFSEILGEFRAIFDHVFDSLTENKTSLKLTDPIDGVREFLNLLTVAWANKYGHNVNIQVNLDRIFTKDTQASLSDSDKKLIQSLLTKQEEVQPAVKEERPIETLPAKEPRVEEKVEEKGREIFIKSLVDLGMTPGDASSLTTTIFGDKEISMSDAEKILSVLKSALGTQSIPIDEIEDLLVKLLLPFGYDAISTRSRFRLLIEKEGITDFFKSGQQAIEFIDKFLTGDTSPVVIRSTVLKTKLIDDVKEIFLNAGKTQAEADAFIASRISKFDNLIGLDDYQAVITEANNAIASDQKKPDSYTPTSVDPWEKFIEDIAYSVLTQAERDLSKNFNYDQDRQIVDEAKSLAMETIQKWINTKRGFTDRKVAEKEISALIEATVRKRAIEIVGTERKSQTRQAVAELSNSFWGAVYNQFEELSRKTGRNFYDIKAFLDAQYKNFVAAIENELAKSSFSLSPLDEASRIFATAKLAVAGAIGEKQRELQPTSQTNMITPQSIQENKRLIGIILSDQTNPIALRLSGLIQARGANRDEVMHRLEQYVLDVLGSKIGSLVPDQIGGKPVKPDEAWYSIVSSAIHEAMSKYEDKIVP